MNHDMKPKPDGGEMRCVRCGIKTTVAYASGSDECPVPPPLADGPVSAEEQARRDRIWAAVQSAAGVG